MPAHIAALIWCESLDRLSHGLRYYRPSDRKSFRDLVKREVEPISDENLGRIIELMELELPSRASRAALVRALADGWLKMVQYW